jgi:hypothetical protein
MVAPLVILVAIVLGGQLAAFLLGAMTTADAIAGAVQALVVLALVLVDTLPYALGWRSNALYWRHMAERLAGEVRGAPTSALAHRVALAACRYMAEVDHGLSVADEDDAMAALKSVVCEYDPEAIWPDDGDEQDDSESADSR